MDLIIEYLMKLVKYVPKNMGALVGIVQAVVELIREMCMLVTRLICPIIPGDADEKIVAKIRGIAEVVLELLEKLKNWLLKLGFGD